MCAGYYSGVRSICRVRYSSLAWGGKVYDIFMCAGYYSGIRSVCRVRYSSLAFTTLSCVLDTTLVLGLSVG